MAKACVKQLRWLASLSASFLMLSFMTDNADHAYTSAVIGPLTTIQLQRVVTGLSSPVYVTNAHDASNRLFIVEQPGRIQVLQPGQSVPAVFLDITSRVLSGGEQGLLGLAFHPQFASNGRFFVDYTRQSDGATVIAE